MEEIIRGLKRLVFHLLSLLEGLTFMLLLTQLSWEAITWSS